MNKYHEAFYEIITALKKDDLYMGDSSYDFIDKDDITLIQELVDKATPVKPFLLVEHKNPKKRRYQCPICGNACLVRYAPFERNENRHCYNCGQKIDWSENE